jgi:predicted TIM-barrel fold metal-dependent hydrolase
MMMKMIEEEQIVNIHVHLPLLSGDLLQTYKEGDHSLLPADILEEIIPQLEPETYFKQFKGISALYAIEKHNIFGKSCPIYSPNDYVLDICHKYPERVMPFGSLDLRSENIAEEISNIIHQGFIGIKYHALEGYSLEKCHEALSLLEKHELPLVIHLGDTPFPNVNLSNADPKNLIYIANKFPSLRMLITHFGTPLHHSAFWVASRYENVFMDTAEYPVYWVNGEDNPYGPLLSPLHTKRVGINKIIFGTDFPMPTLVQDSKTKQISLVNHDIHHYINSIKNLPDHYMNPQEKSEVLSENVWNFLGKQKQEIISCNKKI